MNLVFMDIALVLQMNIIDIKSTNYGLLNGFGIRILVIMAWIWIKDFDPSNHLDRSNVCSYNLNKYDEHHKLYLKLRGTADTYTM